MEERMKAMEATVAGLRTELTNAATIVTKLNAEVQHMKDNPLTDIIKDALERIRNFEVNSSGKFADMEAKLSFMKERTDAIKDPRTTPGELKHKDAERHLPVKWTGEKNATPFSEFAFEFGNWLGVLDPTGDAQLLMDGAAKEQTNITDDWVERAKGQFPNAEKVSRAMCSGLTTSTAGMAQTLVRRSLRVEPGNGLRAWQLLNQTYRPRIAMKSSPSITKIIAPKQQTNIAALQAAMAEWELKVAEHENRFNETINDSIKVSALKRMLPPRILDKYLDFAGTYEELRARLMAYVTESISHGMGGSATVPMDIGSLETKPSDEDQDDYTESQWGEWLCSLVKGKGKGGSKGGDRKGGGDWQQQYKDGGKAGGKSSGGKAGGKDGNNGKIGWKSGGKNGGGKAGSGKGPKCYRCQGFGHFARDCATPANNLDEAVEEGADDGVDHDTPDICNVEEHDEAHQRSYPNIGHGWQTVGKKTRRIDKFTPMKHDRPRAATTTQNCLARRSQVFPWSLCGYLSVDDGDEEEELFNLEKIDKKGKVKLTAVVDSGAGANVLPRDAVPFIPIRENDKSRAGKGFVGAGGEKIKNYGEKRFVVQTEEGHERGTNWQIADVRRPLMSVGKMTQAGNEVRLSHADPHILNKKTGEITKLRREGNVYVVDLWIKVLDPARSSASAMSDSKFVGTTAAVKPGAKSSGENRSGLWSRGNGDAMDLDHVEHGKASHFTRQAR